jgi:hypothetical protein
MHGQLFKWARNYIQWNNDDVHFVLDQHAELNLYIANMFSLWYRWNNCSFGAKPQSLTKLRIQKYIQYKPLRISLITIIKY